MPKKTAAGNWPDLVHFVTAPGECRPAIVTAEFTDEPSLYCNLMVVQDGENDTTGEVLDWKTSVYRTTDGEPHTWHAAHQCAEVTAAYRAAHPTPTPPEEAPQASSSGGSAGGGAEGGRVLSPCARCGADALTHDGPDNLVCSACGARYDAVHTAPTPEGGDGQ